MDNEEEFADEQVEVGSDDLLADEDLRLPESASILVRLHAVRSWLARRQQDMTIEMGEAALELQETLAQSLTSQNQEQALRPRRRREQDSQEARLRRIQQQMLAAQQQQSAYEEAQTLLEECVTHASGERVLVEYYLALEDLVQAYLLVQQQADQPPETIDTPWLRAMSDVQHRVERVGTPHEEE